MKNFHFRLEALLKIKKQNIKKIQQKLLELEQEVRVLHKKKKEKEQEIFKIQETLRTQRQKGVLKENQNEILYLEQLYEEIQLMEKRETLLKLEFEKSQGVLSIAIREGKIVEKLKEKKYALWQVKNKNAENGEIQS
jgi:flagellar biosynthesis chaperone FliJ